MYLKTLAGTVARDGVTVNMVLPGRVDTDRVAQLDRAAAERTGVTPEASRTSSVPPGWATTQGRWSTPEGLRGDAAPPPDVVRQVRADPTASASAWARASASATVRDTVSPSSPRYISTLVRSAPGRRKR